jgi:hypothetical protein
VNPGLRFPLSETEEQMGAETKMDIKEIGCEARRMKETALGSVILQVLTSPVASF